MRTVDRTAGARVLDVPVSRRYLDGGMAEQVMVQPGCLVAVNASVDPWSVELVECSLANAIRDGAQW
ncbi:hypothetical protein [Saccharopolyspora tripterygii]